MFLRARTAVVARIAAALVALALSGVPRALALPAPETGHRCSCKSHHGNHECECPICRRAALAALASDEKLPPCHRAAARKAQAREERAARRTFPCIEGACGGSGQPVLAPVGTEPFFTPSALAVARAERTEFRPCATTAARERSLEPETPPPRPA